MNYILLLRQDFNGLFPWPAGPFEKVIKDQNDSVTTGDTIQFDGVTGSSVFTESTASGLFNASTLFSSQAEDTIIFRFRYNKLRCF